MRGLSLSTNLRICIPAQKVVVFDGVALMLECVEHNLQGIVYVVCLGSEIHIYVDFEWHRYQRAFFRPAERTPPKKLLFIIFEFLLLSKRPVTVAGDYAVTVRFGGCLSRDGDTWIFHFAAS